MKTAGVSLFDRRKPSKLNKILNIILAVVIFVCLSELAFSLRFATIWVDGISMLPTLTGEYEALGLKGDYVFADKTLSPDYGDIVVVRRTVRINGKENTTLIIKRVVAFGGDSVKMENGVLYLKRAGEEEYSVVEENYISPLYMTPSKAKNNFAEHLVGEGMIYVLGDNRDVSNDSRAHGDFSANAVLGVVPEWALQNKGIITGFFNFLNSFFMVRTGG